MTEHVITPLQQLAPIILQLGGIVFCSVDFCRQLLAAHAYQQAVDQMRVAVKDLTTHLSSVLERVISTDPSADPMSHQALACTLSVLQATTSQLLPIALQSAELISGSHGAVLPKEMCSFAVLNLAWASLTRLLLQVPEQYRQQVIQPEQADAGLTCALHQLGLACQELRGQPAPNRTIVVKFWVQCVVKLVGCSSASAGELSWDKMLATVCQLYMLLTDSR